MHGLVDEASNSVHLGLFTSNKQYYLLNFVAIFVPHLPIAPTYRTCKKVVKKLT